MRDREPDDRDLEYARRRLRTALGFLQLGGLAFLAVVAIGLLPRLLAGRPPAAASGALQLAAVAAAAVVAIGSVALGIRRLRRMLRDPDPPASGAAPPSP
jgi:hypothetical protein